MMLNLNSLNPNQAARRPLFKEARNTLLNPAASVQSNQAQHRSDQRQLAERRRRNLAIVLDRRKGGDRRNHYVPTNACSVNKIDTLA